MERIKSLVVALLVLLAVNVFFAGYVSALDILPVAIFKFEERGSGVRGLGEKVSDILFANLVVKPDLYIVDRADLDKIIKEQTLNLSGMVSPDRANEIGELTGAKIMLTGSIVDSGSKLYLVARVIGTETSRVLGESVKGDAAEPLDVLVDQLAEKVYAVITQQSDKLVVKSREPRDRIAAINKALGSAKRPTVSVNIEERHVGQTTLDPAAETEIIFSCKSTGFDVLDAKSGVAGLPDVLIQGEGISEFGTRMKDIVSVKARLEVKAIERSTSRVIAVERQTAIELDLTEQIAGKKALQKAAAAIAERLLPKLVK